jgi:hypothetical protein
MTRSCGRSTANTAGYAGFGLVAMSKSGILSTNLAVQSTPDGYSIAIRPGLTNDESGYRFGVDAFLPGEYVSIHGDDGKMHTFRVKSLESVT